MKIHLTTAAASLFILLGVGAAAAEDVYAIRTRRGYCHPGIRGKGALGIHQVAGVWSSTSALLCRTPS